MITHHRNTHSPVVVLGMHKSGTTLVAETLHRSGIAMVSSDTRRGYDEGNKMERAEAVSLNVSLLGDDRSESLRLIRPLVAGMITKEHQSEAQAMIDSLGAGPWGFKDPRTLLTFYFWNKIFVKPILVGVFRDPIEVFEHYVSRAGRKWVSRDPTYLPDALRAWCIYNQRLLDLKRENPDILIIDYSEFMTTDMGMHLLSTRVGRDLVDCRKPKMRRAKAKRTIDYRMARLIVKLRDRLNPDLIHKQLRDVRDTCA